MARRIPEMEPYAERIAQIKRVQNMSHAELAAKLMDATSESWTSDRVGHLINARMVITVDLLGHVAEIQRMPLDYYVHGEVEPGKALELLTQRTKGGTYNLEYENRTDRILELDAA